METTQFAPVLIPTLNRFDHLKRCLESLERCVGAEKTDVYVGLDFPPSEKYVEGWKKIDSYLTEKEKSNGFKKLYIRRRDHNCGVSGPGNNYYLLYQEIASLWKVYIISEDDNEFSPNFLEYMNKGLTRFQNSNEVMAISGYMFPEVEFLLGTSAFLSPFSNAWGTGYWVGKVFEHAQKGGKNFVDEILHSWRMSWKLFGKRAASLNGILSMHFRNQYYGDVLNSAEMLLKEKYTLYPSVSKVRNWGHDGSGVHCDLSEKYRQQEIDSDVFFDLSNHIPVVEIAKNLDFGVMKRFAVLLRYVGFRLTGNDWMAFYWRMK